MNDLPKSFMETVYAIIDRNISNENFSIDALCKELPISYSHTYRKIREETGLSPSMYVCKKRLEKACELLETTDLKMNKIALRVGFKTQAYFSTCFTKLYGFSPLQYRQKNKLKKINIRD